VGDRQTGRTTVALDTIFNQHNQDVLCIYCAIGQRTSGVTRVVSVLREKGVLEYTIVLVTEGNDPHGLPYEE